MRGPEEQDRCFELRNLFDQMIDRAVATLCHPLKSGIAIDLQSDFDQLVGQSLRIVKQPFHAFANGFLRGLIGSVSTQVLQAILARRVAMFVRWNSADNETELVHALGMFVRRQDANLPALRLANKVSLLDARSIHEIQEVLRKS